MLGGAQTWVYTAARALHEAGHEPLVWSAGLGEIARRTEEFARCSTRLRDLAPWDVVWGSHQLTALVPPRAPRCQIVHATQNQDQEAPIPGLDAYFAVSEEVADLLASRGLWCEGIVRQPVDVERFHPRTPLRPWPPRVLHFGNYQRWVPIVEQACRRLGAPFAVLGGPTDARGRRWDVETLIDQADLVVGQSRCVLEAMACGRNAVVCSGWDPDEGYGLDGFVTPATYRMFRAANLTGNIHRRVPTADAIAEEIARYDPALGPELRRVVVEAHAPLTALQPLIDWTRQAVGPV